MKNVFGFLMCSTLLVSLSFSGAAAGAKPSILVLGEGGGGMKFLMDPVLERKLEEKGYRVASLWYEDFKPDYLRWFNLVVMLHEPNNLEGKGKEILKDAGQILDYVQKGGGLLIFYDEFHYRSDYKSTLNLFLDGLGARVWREPCQEKDKDNEHRFSLLAHGWPPVYRATQVTPHPVTEGVKEFWYPALLGVIKVQTPWKVVLRAEPSASFANAYRKSPPLLAVRPYGKGRVALCAGHSSFYVNNGYHRAYEYGWCFEKGDGWRLFENLFRWLGAPSIQSKRFGGYKQGMLPPLKPRGAWKIERWTALERGKAFGGVFGVYTRYSGGVYNVSDFCEKARKLGVQFVVFTDRITRNADWEAFNAACEQQSDKGFLAIPGVEFKDPNGNVGCATNIETWPPSGIAGAPTFITALLQTSGRRAGIYTVLAPKQNTLPPWRLGGFNSLEVLSYNDRVAFAASLDWFRRLQSVPGMNVLPAVSHRIWTPDQLEGVWKEGFRFYLYAPSLEKLPSLFHFGYRAGFVTNGPVVDEFWAENMMHDVWESYLLWNPGTEAVLHVSVRSEAPLERVDVLSGRRLVRRFVPRSKRLKTVARLPFSEDGSLYLEVRDRRGRWAVTSAIPTRNENYWNHVGSDRMNDYHNPILPDAHGQIVFPDGTLHGFGGLVTFGYGWGNYIRFYHPVPAEAYHPQGYETGQIQAGLANLRTAPKVFAPRVTELDNAVPWRDSPLATRDVAVVHEIWDHTFVDAKYAPSRDILSEDLVTIYRYQYRPFGYIICLIETRVRPKRSIKLARRKGLELVLLEAQFRGSERFKKLIYIDENGVGKEVDIDLTKVKPNTPILGTVGAGGFVTLSPDPFGLVGIYTLDEPMDFELYGGVLRLGLDRDGGKLLQKSQHAARFLVIEEGGGQSASLWERLRGLWGLTPAAKGKPAYEPEVSGGESRSRGYIVHLATKEHGVRARFPDVKDLPNHILPVVVDGMNPNWSCGAVRPDGTFYPGGVYQGRLYLGLESWGDGEYFLGHPLVADKNEVRLEIARFEPSGIVYQVHNPTPKTIACTIRASEYSTLRIAVQEVSLKPGETKKLMAPFR